MSLFTRIFSPAPPDPNMYDLRHFTWITWSDASDGVAVPSDGYFNRVLLYRGKMVYAKQQLRKGGKLEETTEKGHPDFMRIADMGRNYLELVRRMHGLPVPAESRDISLGVTVTKRMEAALLGHPDFMELVDKFIGIGWHLSFEPVTRSTLVDAVAKYDPPLFVEG